MRRRARISRERCPSALGCLVPAVVQPTIAPPLVPPILRCTSSYESIELSAAAPFLSEGWVFDVSKDRGHVISLRTDAFIANFAGACHPFRSNEFWNVATEVIPLCFFSSLLADKLGAQRATNRRRAAR